MRRARIREGALWGAKIVSTFPEWAGLQAKPNFRHPQARVVVAVVRTAPALQVGIREAGVDG